MHRSRDTSQPVNDEARPFLELRVGGVHLIVQRVPHRLLILASAALGSGAVWFTR